MSSFTKKLFVVRDEVQNSYLSQFVAVSVNHQSYIRQFLPVLYKAVPLRDVRLYEIAEFDEVSGLLKSYKHPILRDWSDYKFPESKAANLSELGMTPDEIEKVFQSKAKESLSVEKENELKKSNGEVSNS